MGVATFLVALVPTYETIGIWGAVILTVLRFIQGIGVGGEWDGSVLLVFAFVYFALLDTKNPTWIFAAIVLSLIPHNMMCGPRAALIAEAFTGRLRNSGSSLGINWPR